MESGQNSLETSSRPQRILVLENSSRTRQLIIDVLTREGYKVIAPVDVKEALRDLKDINPDLVLTDINATIIEVLARLRDSQSARYTPVALLVDKSDKSREQDSAAGMNQWIEKPFTPETLLEGIRKYI